MKIKLVAIDLDDTLLTSELKITESSLTAIRQVCALGIKVTIATGRMFKSAVPFAHQLSLGMPLITYQGALIKDYLTDEVLFCKPLPKEVGVDIFHFFKQAGIHVQGYFADHLVMEALQADGRDYVSMAKVKPLIVEDILQQANKEPTLKILAVIHDPDLLSEMAGILHKQFGSEINITRSKPYFLEVMHGQVNKGAALKVLADQYRVLPEEVLVCGDSYNDLEMIKWAGMGVVMGNADDYIKEQGDFVTRTNDEDGVAYALKRLILLDH